jgi:chromate transport protein ChrA
MALILGLLSFAGPLAISAVFTMSIVCQYVGFATPIIARWVGGQKFVRDHLYYVQRSNNRGLL